jgi:hypothetical protein
MRLISFSVTISLALLSSVALAQQSPETTDDKAVGDKIGSAATSRSAANS